MEEQKDRRSLEERLVTERNAELERDIWRLKDKLEDFLDFHNEFQNKYGQTLGWDPVDDLLFWDVYWPWYLLEPIPDEEE
jgi:hypothetical protein